MEKVKILKELLPVRCEVCHKSDMFDVDKQECFRCKDVEQGNASLHQRWQAKNRPLAEKNERVDVARQENAGFAVKPSMECYNHPGETVVGCCKECQKAVCRACATDKYVGLYCKKCLDKFEEINERGVLVLIFFVIVAVVMGFAFVVSHF